MSQERGNHSVKIIGLTGGVASGKSTVAYMFKKLGAKVIDADNICHKLLRSTKIKEEICKIWGDVIKDNYGDIRRDKLAEIAFSNKENVEKLNLIIHPTVIKHIKKQIADIKREGINNVIIIDAALLVESDLASLCNTIIFVDTNIDIREERAQKARHWQKMEITRREGLQISTEYKKQQAKFIINNNNSKDNTFKQVCELWNKLQKQGKEAVAE